MQSQQPQQPIGQQGQQKPLDPQAQTQFGGEGLGKQQPLSSLPQQQQQQPQQFSSLPQQSGQVGGQGLAGQPTQAGQYPPGHGQGVQYQGQTFTGAYKGDTASSYDKPLKQEAKEQEKLTHAMQAQAAYDSKTANKAVMHDPNASVGTKIQAASHAVKDWATEKKHKGQVKTNQPGQAAPAGPISQAGQVGQPGQVGQSGQVGQQSGLGGQQLGQGVQQPGTLQGSQQQSGTGPYY
jgi:hypothetical protein